MVPCSTYPNPQHKIIYGRVWLGIQLLSFIRWSRQHRGNWLHNNTPGRLLGTACTSSGFTTPGTRCIFTPWEALLTCKNLTERRSHKRFLIYFLLMSFFIAEEEFFVLLVTKETQKWQKHVKAFYVSYSLTLGFAVGSLLLGKSILSLDIGAPSSYK